MKIALLTTDNREPFREYHKPEPWFGTAPEALLQGFARLPELEVHVLSCTQQPMRSPEKLAGNIWFHSLHVPKFGWLRTGYQGCVRAIRRQLRELRPDLVHGQGTERECSLSAVLSGRRNLVTIHGNMRTIGRVNRSRPFSYGWLAAGIERFTLPRADGVVCLTNHTRRAVAGLARRTWVVPNAVDATFFKLDPHPTSVPVILVIGNVIRLKNQNALIRALDPLAARQKFTVNFLGGAVPSDPYVAEFHRLIAARPWCQHTGFAGREDVRYHLTGAALVVLSSLEDNCPMCVLEAMAASVPVAAANVGGVPELIEDRRTGRLFDPLDAQAMCRVVEELLADEPLRAHLACAAREEAERRFYPDVVARRHLEIYHELLNRGN